MMTHGDLIQKSHSELHFLAPAVTLFTVGHCANLHDFPTGTGLQNLRECIVWTKQKFDFEPKKKKPFWQRMSVNFIERYCYLICFATYLKEEAPKGGFIKLEITIPQSPPKFKTV